MSFMKNIVFAALLIGSVYFLSSCNMAGGEFPGREYMPDMAHSVAYEANYYNYYRMNTWGTEDEYKALANPRLPVAGTIPRGYAGIAMETEVKQQQALEDKMLGRTSANGISTPLNGAVPYYYEDTEEDRNRAMAEITMNPFPITADGLARGKELYIINCAICHGEKADGGGYLVRDDGGVYPAQPANLMLDEFVDASEGRFYHSIMYGKNVMGGYADKLSYEERWQVIHYIRSLQAKEKKLSYSEEENTLNSSATPHKVWLAGLEQEANDNLPTSNVEGAEANTDHDLHQEEGGHH